MNKSRGRGKALSAGAVVRFGCADRKSPRGTRGRGKGKGVHAVRQDAAGKSPRGTRGGGKGKGTQE